MSLESIAGFYNLDKSPISEIKIPEPENPVIDLNKFTDSDNRVYDAILETYNPLGDFGRLQASPETFKQLRNDYPLRREYFAYKVVNTSGKERDLLDSLGFM